MNKTLFCCCFPLSCCGAVLMVQTVPAGLGWIVDISEEDESCRRGWKWTPLSVALYLVWDRIYELHVEEPCCELRGGTGSCGATGEGFLPAIQQAQTWHSLLPWKLHRAEMEISCLLKMPSLHPASCLLKCAQGSNTGTKWGRLSVKPRTPFWSQCFVICSQTEAKNLLWLKWL